MESGWTAVHLVLIHVALCLAWCHKARSYSSFIPSPRGRCYRDIFFSLGQVSCKLSHLGSRLVGRRLFLYSWRGGPSQPAEADGRGVRSPWLSLPPRRCDVQRRMAVTNQCTLRHPTTAYYASPYTNNVV